MEHTKDPILQHLNPVAEEVFDKDTHNNWKFSHLVKRYANYVVIFANNSITKETGELAFLTPSSPLNELGQPDKDRWLADFEQAVEEWESFQAGKKNLLDYLNNIAPDTFNKTICDNWKFTNLRMLLTSEKEKHYTLFLQMIALNIIYLLMMFRLLTMEPTASTKICWIF
ncbi:MAG: hypothetical protein IPJ81_01420 [Chitinophagaceae bacterium]|nr:hypothetical protein [Chitinophagaceae bacterium]